MVDFRLIDSSLRVNFEPFTEGKFENEFYGSRSGIDEWLSFERAKGDMENSDPLTIKLLVEVYKKLEELTTLLREHRDPYSPLERAAVATKVGFEGFCFGEDTLEAGETYFGRLNLNISLKRVIPVQFVALDARAAKITRIAPNDEKEWSHFVAQSEIIAIRKAKGHE